MLTLSTDFLITNDGDGADTSVSPNIEKAQDRTIVPPTDLNLDPAVESDGGDQSGTETEGETGGEQ